MPETLTPKQVLLTDEIANEKYVGFYSERKMRSDGYCRRKRSASRFLRCDRVALPSAHPEPLHPH